MKCQLNEIRSLTADSTARGRGMGTIQFAESIKNTTRRAAAVSSIIVDPASAYGCVDWFRYPDTVPDESASADASRG